MWKFQDFLSPRFYVKSTSENLEVLKLLIFAILEALKSAKIHKNQNSEPLNVLKWQIFRLYIRHLWFHVKFEWQKNSVISTLSHKNLPISWNWSNPEFWITQPTALMEATRTFFCWWVIALAKGFSNFSAEKWNSFGRALASKCTSSQANSLMSETK